MSKKIFVLLLSLMSISLAGIIFIQSYFILKNYEENDKQFSSNIKYALTETISEIEKIELQKKYNSLEEINENLKKKLSDFEDRETKDKIKEEEFSEKIDELNQETDSLMNEIEKWQM